jgi:transposase
MKRAHLLQELRKMKFESIYEDWQERKLTQIEAARLLDITERTFRRYITRYREEGLEGLEDQRISRASHRAAPVDEVLHLKEKYRRGFSGWNVKHFYSWYKRDGGSRSYTWVKNTLQQARLVKKSQGKGKHRKRRARSPMPGMMIHQDGSTHQWVPGKYWDLIVTMDDATNEHYSMFFVEEEGTLSSFIGVAEVIQKCGLFCSFYSDRGSHYWNTPIAGGSVDKIHVTQFGQALKQLNIHMIPAYSPQARGRSERAFSTHQERLPKELAKAGITTMEAANQYLKTHYVSAFNQEFKVAPLQEGSAFIDYPKDDLMEVLCERYIRTVGKDNCVSFEGKILQIPANEYRMNYIKVNIEVRRYWNGALGIYHGPRLLAQYDSMGRLLEKKHVA